jgi:hypothetical protein
MPLKYLETELMVAYCPHQLSPPLLATKKDLSIFGNMGADRGDGGKPGICPLPRILEKEESNLKRRKKYTTCKY